MPVLKANYPRRVKCAAGWRLFCLAVALLVCGSAFAQPKATREYDLKAVFLFNFTQFVEWPAAAFTNDEMPFVIGILGDDPFGKNLDEIVASESVHGHKIVVQRLRNIDELKTCHLLFICQSETPRLEKIFKAIDNRKGLLTVGESDAFFARSGMIRLGIVQNKLRVKINLDTARAAQLTISSKLLRQADIVEARNGP